MKRPPKGKLLEMPTTIKVEPAVMPEWLEGYAAEFWREHEYHLAQAGHLDAATQSMFTLLCITYSQLRGIADRIAKDGITIKTPTGRLMQHPLLSEQMRTWRLFGQLSRDFFMAPKRK